MIFVFSIVSFHTGAHIHHIRLEEPDALLHIRRIQPPGKNKTSIFQKLLVSDLLCSTAPIKGFPAAKTSGIHHNSPDFSG